MQASYQKDPVFARLVDETAYKFMQNKQGLPEHKREAYLRLSHAYLMEEIAAFAVMHETAPMIDVRPGSPLKPVLDLLRSGAVMGAPTGCTKIDSVIIDFTRNGAVKR